MSIGLRRVLRRSLLSRAAWVVLTLALPGTQAAAAGSPDTFTVVTLNLYHDRDDWPARQRVIVEGLQRERPDVIVLQEVLQHETLENQAASLARALGYRYQFISLDPPGATRRYGNAILSAHPLRHTSQRALHPREDSRSVGHARISIDGRQIDVYATHLHHTENGHVMRSTQVQGVLALVDATAGRASTIIAGDFNALADAPELHPLTQRFTDAYGHIHHGSGDAASAAAHTTLNPAYFDAPRRIDHVFVDAAALSIVDARRLFERPAAGGTWASDHFGIWVELAHRSAP